MPRTKFTDREKELKHCNVCEEPLDHCSCPCDCEDPQHCHCEDKDECQEKKHCKCRQANNYVVCSARYCANLCTCIEDVNDEGNCGDSALEEDIYHGRVVTFRGKLVQSVDDLCSTRICPYCDRINIVNHNYPMGGTNEELDFLRSLWYQAAVEQKLQHLTARALDQQKKEARRRRFEHEAAVAQPSLSCTDANRGSKRQKAEDFQGNVIVIL